MMIRLGRAETEVRVEILDDRILCRWDIGSDKGAGAMLSCRLGDDVHDLELQFAAEHSAAHDPGVNFQDSRFAWRAEDNGTDDSVVSVTIQQPEVKRKAVRGVRFAGNLLCRIAPGRGVELIGLIDELSHPRQVVFPEGSTNDRHLKSGEELIHTAGYAHEHIALSIAGV